MSVTPGLDADEVLVPVTGAIYSTTNGTLPTSATESLGEGWVGHGYAFKDDGVEVNPRDGATEKEIRAFQNDALLARIFRGGKLTAALTLVQVNAANVGLYFNDTPDASGKVRVRPNLPPDRRKWVIDIVADDRVIRHVIPSGEATPSGPQRYLNDTQVGFPITITGFEDADGVAAAVYYSELSEVDESSPSSPSSSGA